MGADRRGANPDWKLGTLGNLFFPCSAKTESTQEFEALHKCCGSLQDEVEGNLER
jgi:hypothetical protein